MPGGKKGVRPPRYSEDYKRAALLALEANGGNLTKTCKETGITIKTLKDWCAQEKYHYYKDNEIVRQEMVNYLDELLWKLAQAIPGKISNASVAQVATTFGILFDKRQLLLGKPTSITADQTFRDAITRVMQESGCDIDTARKALEIYVPAVRLLNE